MPIRFPAQIFDLSTLSGVDYESCPRLTLNMRGEIPASRRERNYLDYELSLNSSSLIRFRLRDETLVDCVARYIDRQRNTYRTYFEDVEASEYYAETERERRAAREEAQRREREEAEKARFQDGIKEAYSRSKETLAKRAPGWFTHLGKADEVARAGDVTVTGFSPPRKIDHHGALAGDVRERDWNRMTVEEQIAIYRRAARQSSSHRDVAHGLIRQAVPNFVW